MNYTKPGTKFSKLKFIYCEGSRNILFQYIGKQMERRNKKVKKEEEKTI